MDRIWRYRAMVPSLPTIPNPWISGRFPQRLYHPGRKANPANTVCSARVCTLARDLRGLYVFLLDKILQAPDPAILDCSNRSEERRVGKECRSRWTVYDRKE